MHYTAVVKGPANDALKAAHDRGISASLVRTLPATREVVLRIAGADWRALYRWYSEPAGDRFPDGTVLIFSEHPHPGFERTAVACKYERE